MKSPNSTHTDVSITDIDDLQVDLRGDRVRLSSMASPNSFQIYLNIEDINSLVERIGKKMMEKTHKRIPK